MEYLLIVLYLLILVYIYDFRCYAKYKKFNTFVLFWIFVFLAGFRYRVGLDTVSYALYFNKLCPDFTDLNLDSFIYSRYQPLWVLLNSFIKLFGSIILFQIVVALIINICFFYFFKKSTTKFFSGLLIYFLVDYHYFNMDIVRESIAVGFFLVAIIKLQDNKYLKYYGIISLAFLFHFYAFICFFIPLLLTKKINTTIKVITGVISLAIIFSLSSATSSINQLISLFSESNDLSAYAEFEGAEMSLAGLLYNFLRIIPLFCLIIFYSTNKQMYSLLISKRYVLTFSYFYIYIVLIRIFSIPFIERVLNYFIFFLHLILVSFSFDYAKLYFKRNSQFFIILLFVFSHFFFYLSPFLKVNPLYGVKNYKIYYPYYSVFSEKTDKERELIMFKEGK